MLALYTRLALAVLLATNLLCKFIVLELLSGADYLTVFNNGQLEALSLLFLNAYTNGAIIWGTIFSIHLFVIGNLIYRSEYFPKIFGILLYFAALGYLIDSYGNFILPEYDNIYEVIVMSTIPLELIFALWLLIKGLNIEKWKKLTLTST